MHPSALSPRSCLQSQPAIWAPWVQQSPQSQHVLPLSCRLKRVSWVNLQSILRDALFLLQLKKSESEAEAMLLNGCKSIKIMSIWFWMSEWLKKKRGISTQTCTQTVLLTIHVDLLAQFNQLHLCWHVAHRPHAVPQVLTADKPIFVFVKLLERLTQL